jgi:hypothetical protein
MRSRWTSWSDVEFLLATDVTIYGGSCPKPQGPRGLKFVYTASRRHRSVAKLQKSVAVSLSPLPAALLS